MSTSTTTTTSSTSPKFLSSSLFLLLLSITLTSAQSPIPQASSPATQAQTQTPAQTPPSSLLVVPRPLSPPSSSFSPSSTGANIIINKKEMKIEVKVNNNTGTTAREQNWARMFHTSIAKDSEEELDVTFFGLKDETGCHESCWNDYAVYDSHTWREADKTCFCRPGSINLFKPIRSPFWYPALKVSTTFKISCTELSGNPIWSLIPCEDVRIGTKVDGSKGLVLTNGKAIKPF